MHARLQRAGRLSPVGPALLLAVVLLGDGALVLSRSFSGPVPAATTEPAGPAGPDEARRPEPPGEGVPAPAGAGASPARTGPWTLAVPRLGVDRASLPLGTEPDGALQVPATAADVGWYAGSAVPGEVGPAVFAGHVDLDGQPGVFSRLGALRPGDAVSVGRADGAVVRFVVTRVEQHPKDAFPTDEVYGPTTTPTLRLITCGGSFDRRSGSYRDNVVAFARLA